MLFLLSEARDVACNESQRPRCMSNVLLSEGLRLEAWPGFMNGIHGLPTLSDGRRLWGNILGRPASYGCIILDLKNAKWLYDWAEDGVVVEIEA